MRCDNRVRNYKMGYSATYPIGVVCRKQWGSEGVWSEGVGSEGVESEGVGSEGVGSGGVRSGGV